MFAMFTDTEVTSLAAANAAIDAAALSIAADYAATIATQAGVTADEFGAADIVVADAAAAALASALTDVTNSITATETSMQSESSGTKVRGCCVCVQFRPR
jgi:hypothetical protein